MIGRIIRIFSRWFFKYSAHFLILGFLIFWSINSYATYSYVVSAATDSIYSDYIDSNVDACVVILGGNTFDEILIIPQYFSSIPLVLFNGSANYCGKFRPALDGRLYVLVFSNVAGLGVVFATVSKTGYLTQLISLLLGGIVGMAFVTAITQRWF